MLIECGVTERHQGELTLLPYAIGDGATRRPHLNDVDAASSLFLLNRGLTERHHSLVDPYTTSEFGLVTYRLDDVLDDAPVDLRKLDLQGAEPLILENAVDVLGRTAVLHCDVEFAATYLGQPPFDEIVNFLRFHDYELIGFV